MKIGGYRINASLYVSDWRRIRRPWRERLFTRPWRPFVKYKQVKSPAAFVVGSEVTVSFDTYIQLRRELESERRREMLMQILA